MAWNQSDLDALEIAIKSGNSKVKYQDREVTYRSLEEMMAIRDLIRKELGQVSNQIKVIKTQFSKGL